MAGSSTADAAQTRLRPAVEGDLDFVLAVEADPDTAPFLAAATREYHLGLMADPTVEHFIVEADGRPVGFVMVQTDAANRALYRSEGFHEEGLMRDALLFDGDFQSLILMSILRHDYE